MKYINLTKEQKDSISNYLRNLFEHRERLLKEYTFHSEVYILEKQIKSFQQAQKEEIYYINHLLRLEDEINIILPRSVDFRLEKLKFESELE